MIRPYQPTDFNELINLVRLNTPEFFAESEETDFIDYLENELEDYFVILENNTIIGSGGINYFPKEKVARISWDMIHPDFQGKGVGRALTEHRLNVIKNRNDVALVMVRTSQLAYQFYQKMGFELEKIEKNFWAEGFDLYQMIKPVK